MQVKSQNAIEHKYKTLWYLIILSTAIYPYLLQSFAAAMDHYSAAIDVTTQFGATLISATAMVICVTTPLLAIYLSAHAVQDRKSGCHGRRALTLMISATPPLYIVTLQIMAQLNLASVHKPVWVSSFLIGGALLSRSVSPASKFSKSVLPFKWLRNIHIGSAIALVAGFIAFHLINHLFALNSYNMHEKVRIFLNGWYQSIYVEPILFALLIIMAITGLLMAARYFASTIDIYKSVQIGSGLFMLFFFIAHVNAVLSARARNVETDWIFATGEKGLLQGGGILIPYYILSVAMVLLHISAGVRKAMLTRNTPVQQANEYFKKMIYASLGFTFFVTLAILGVQF